jgi:hypothetical protein
MKLQETVTRCIVSLLSAERYLSRHLNSTITKLNQGKSNTVITARNATSLSQFRQF